ncbi:hypothetical protein KP509_19G017500, partial [Ceratopteris richardii]
SSPAEVVIAVDFGTTFSGFGFTKTSLSPHEIFDNCKWPGDAWAGAAPYCKIQTSLFYVPDPAKPGHFQVKDRGWSAFTAYQSDAQDSLNITEELADEAGYFAHKFKLHLAPNEMQMSSMVSAPGDLSPERMVVDYLRSLTNFIMNELTTAIRKDFSMRDVQWCLTVPAVWDESAKQQMKACAEKAGMIKGVNCPRDASPSPRALHIILEPEAASVYWQLQAQHNLKLEEGDRILIADVGGGTIDLVVHEVVELHPKGGASKVKEVVASYGQIGGGTFVDNNFFDVVAEKIGCFWDYCRSVNPFLPTQLYSWCRRIKAEFTVSWYDEEFGLVTCGLSKAWKKYDLQPSIDPEVEKVLGLIEKQSRKVSILMVVGGFAGSPYLKKQVISKFSSEVKEIIIPTDPGRAICRPGAVELHLRKNFIKSRISKLSYGIGIRRPQEDDDPLDLIVVDDDGRPKCDKAMSVFVRAGEEVELGSSIEDSYFPSLHHQESMRIPLYSSPRTYPRYTNETDTKLEGSFEIDMSDEMELDKSREIRVRMEFGDALLNVSALRSNFGTDEEEHGLAVTFECTR